MKKTLVALAALASVSAFAQSTSVELTGFFDRGYRSTSSSDATASLKSVASNTGTTNIFFKGTEDLGNGTKAGFLIETDWADLGGASQKSATLTTAQSAGFANGENFLSLGNQDVGTLKFGAVNSLTYGNAAGVAQPAFGTGVGSSYSTRFSIASGISTGADGYSGQAQNSTTYTSTAAANVGARAIRIANTFQYATPSFNGFTAGVAITPQNNNQTNTSKNGNTVGVNEYSLRYTQGPIDAAYTSIQYKVGSNNVNQYVLVLDPTAATTAVNTSKSLVANETSTQNLLGATYTTPVAGLKVHGGSGNFSSDDNTYKGKSTQMGATYTTGAWDFMGQIAKVTDQSATKTQTDRKLTGLGANYNLSKRTRLYARYEKVDYGNNVTAFTGSSVKITAVGMSTNF